METTRTLNALMSLTDEPNEKLYCMIADKIVSCGEQILPLLKKNLVKAKDDFHYKRIENLIYSIEYQDVITKFKTWHSNRQHDLMEPYFILSRHRFPNLDWNWIGFQTIMIVEQLEQELNENLTPLEQIKTINHIIYDVNGFDGNIKAVNNPDSYFINTLIDTKEGNPLSLGMLYSIVAQRLNLPVYGIDLPNHFILAYTRPTTRHPKIEDVLFYINPYNKGMVLTKKDIRKYLDQLNITPELRFFEPINNVEIIKKLFNTLMDTYIINGNEREADEMREIINDTKK